jgi:hypothetical protein
MLVKCTMCVLVLTVPSYCMQALLVHSLRGPDDGLLLPRLLSLATEVQELLSKVFYSCNMRHRMREAWSFGFSIPNRILKPKY